MNRQHEIFESIKELENVLDNGFPLIPNSLVVVKYNRIDQLIQRIYLAVPREIKEAKELLENSDKIQLEAQQRAEQIIIEAQNEAKKILSESDVLRQVQIQAEKIKEQVIAECRDMEKKAQEGAELIRTQAKDEAVRIKEGAEVYAEQVLAEIEQNLTQLQQVVKNGQVYMERLRTQSNSDNSGLYSQSSQQQTSDYRIE